MSLVFDDRPRGSRLSISERACLKNIAKIWNLARQVWRPSTGASDEAQLLLRYKARKNNPGFEIRRPPGPVLNGVDTFVDPPADALSGFELKLYFEGAGSFGKKVDDPV